MAAYFFHDSSCGQSEIGEGRSDPWVILKCVVEKAVFIDMQVLQSFRPQQFLQ